MEWAYIGKTNPSPDWGWLLAEFGWPLFLTCVLTSCHIHLARVYGLIDHPSDRKFHKQPTPTGAGLALYIAIGGFAFVTGEPTWSSQLSLVGLIVLVGLIDDIRPLPSQLRLVIHGLIAFPAVLLVMPWASWEYLAAGTFWVLMLIHAFNFIDNMDGLCAGVAWILAGCVAVIISEFGAYPIILSTRIVRLGFSHLIMLFGALTGFLWFNRPPARVFMGDAGSTFLGFFLGVASLPLLFDSGRTFHLDTDEKVRLSANWLAPVCMFALPIYDLASVAVLRVWQRRGLFVSDKNNLSHRLVALGMRPPRAVLLLWLLAVVGGVGGLLLYLVPEPAKTILGIGQLAGWWLGLPVIEYAIHSRRVRSQESGVRSQQSRRHVTGDTDS